MTCAKRPENPCPIWPARETATVPEAPKRDWLTMFRFKEKGAGEKNPLNVPPQTQNSVCRESDRLEWEARLMHWGADCQSKLGRVRGLIQEFNTQVPES